MTPVSQPLSSHPLLRGSAPADAETRPALKHSLDGIERRSVSASASASEDGGGSSLRASLDLANGAGGGERKEGGAEVKVIVHEVRPTDSLAGVSLLYGISLPDLRRANKLWASDTIHLRRVLYIPLHQCRLPATLGVTHGAGGEVRVYQRSRSGSEATAPPPTLNGIVEGQAGAPPAHGRSGSFLGEGRDAASEFLPTTNTEYFTDEAHAAPPPPNILRQSPISSPSGLPPSAAPAPPPPAPLQIAQIPSSQLAFFPPSRQPPSFPSFPSTPSLSLPSTTPTAPAAPPRRPSETPTLTRLAKCLSTFFAEPERRQTIDAFFPATLPVPRRAVSFGGTPTGTGMENPSPWGDQAHELDDRLSAVAAAVSGVEQVAERGLRRRANGSVYHIASSRPPIPSFSAPASPPRSSAAQVKRRVSRLKASPPPPSSRTISSAPTPSHTAPARWSPPSSSATVTRQPVPVVAPTFDLDPWSVGRLAADRER